MRIIIHKNYDELSKWNAYYIAGKINAAKPTRENPYVLGLPTGSSPIGTYQNLVKLNKIGRASCRERV